MPMIPPPPPSRPPRWGSLSHVVLALAAIAVAVACGGLAVEMRKLGDGLREQAQEVRNLEERLRVDAELGRATTALAAFESTMETRKFEFEHAMSCLAFLEMMSFKPNFETFAADPTAKVARGLFSKAVFDIENVNYSTKDADHPATRELKACVAPNGTQERIAFPDELSVIVFRDRFDAQVEPVFAARLDLALNALASALVEYGEMEAPAKRLIDGEVGDLVCKTPVRRLFLRKARSELIRTRIAAGRWRSIDDYIGANCPG